MLDCELDVVIKWLILLLVCFEGGWLFIDMVVDWDGCGVFVIVFLVVFVWSNVVVVGIGVLWDVSKDDWDSLGVVWVKVFLDDVFWKWEWWVVWNVFFDICLVVFLNLFFEVFWVDFFVVLILIFEVVCLVFVLRYIFIVW